MKLDGRLVQVMRREILQCLRETQQIDGGARLLGLGRQTPYNRVKALHIGPSDWRGLEPEMAAPPGRSRGRAYVARLRGAGYCFDCAASDERQGAWFLARLTTELAGVIALPLT